MATCDVALLPLQQGLPQSCKTPIKWMEAAAESVAVVGGPELYGPWLASGEFGLYAQTIKEIIPMARWLVDNPRERQAMVQRAYNRIDDFSLEQQTKWRIHLYSHLERYFDSLDESLLNRFNRNVKTG